MTSRALFRWDQGLNLVSQPFWHLPELTPETPHAICIFRFFPTLFSSHEKKTFWVGKVKGEREEEGPGRAWGGFLVPPNDGAEIRYPGCCSRAVLASTSVPPHAAGTVSLSVRAGARLTEELCSGLGGFPSRRLSPPFVHLLLQRTRAEMAGHGALLPRPHCIWDSPLSPLSLALIAFIMDT